MRGLKGVFSVVSLIVFTGSLLFATTSCGVDYDDIEVIMDVNDYYPMSMEEVKEIYGEPDEDNIYTYIYNLNGYTITFNFNNMYIESIYYEPIKPITYKKDTKEIFYMFGLGETFHEFEEKENVLVDNREAYMNKEGSVFVVTFWERDKEMKTVGKVIINFKEYLPEVKVFEDDFSDVEMVLDLFQFIGLSKMDLYVNFGQPDDTLESLNWYYNTNVGELEIGFDNYDKVESVDIYLKDNMRYDTSIQEALVMFGVSPERDDLTLVSTELYSELYEMNNTEYRLGVAGIDREEKTFGKVGIAKARVKE